MTGDGNLQTTGFLSCSTVRMEHFRVPTKLQMSFVKTWEVGLLKNIYELLTPDLMANSCGAIIGFGE